MEACDAAIPYTLLGFLLWGGGGQTTASGFFKQYLTRATNSLLWISLISITFLLLHKLGRLARVWVLSLRIPGSPSPSLFGRRNLIAGCGPGRDITSYLSKLHKKYGPIVRLWMSPTHLLVSVNDVSLIKEVLVKATDKVALTGRMFQLAFGRCSLFTSSFEKVRKLRESLLQHMDGKLLERANVIPQRVMEFIMGRVEFIGMKGIADCRSVSQNMAFYTLGATIFGNVFLAWSSATDYRELLTIIGKDACFWTGCNVPPFWRRGFWRYQFMCTRLKHLTQDIIQQCRDNKLIGQNEQSSYENYFIWEEIMGDSKSKDQCGNLLGVMFHGYLNTANLITAILMRLVLYPEIQEKIYLEVIAMQIRKCNLDLPDVQKMQFLLATVYESARLLPAGPLLQRCSLGHDLSLQTGITVPAGAIIVVPLPLVQMDTSIWGKDACQFNPLRFLSRTNHPGSSAEGAKTDSVPMTAVTGSIKEHNAFGESLPTLLTEPKSNAEFLPFGFGARACIGQKFAILGISKLIASLLQKYELRLHPHSENNTCSVMENCAIELLPNPMIIFVKREGLK